MAEDIIKAKITFDTPKLSGGLGGFGGGSKGSSKGAALAGAVGGAVGGAVVAGLTMVAGILKKGFDAVKKASPRLQASLSIFGKGIMLLLRPIGDILSTIIRPVALAFLRFAIPFYRNWKESFTGWFDSLEKKTEETSPGKKVESNIGDLSGTGMGGGIGGTIGIGLDILKGAWDILVGLFKILAGVVVAFTKGLVFLLDIALKPFVDFLRPIVDIFLAGGEAIKEFGDAFLKFAIDGDLATFTQAVIDSFKKFTAVLLDIIFKPFIDGAVALWKSWVELFIKIWNPIKDFFTNTIPRWINTLVGSFSGLIEKVSGFFGFGRKNRSSTSSPGKANGGFINPSSSFLVGENGPEIISPTKPGFVNPNSSGRSGTNITVNVNALDASSIDSSAISKITQAVEQAIKGGLLGRTTEAFGID